MKLPLIIYAVISFAGLLVEANRHGKDREGKYNLWSALVASAISWALLGWILNWY